MRFLKLCCYTSTRVPDDICQNVPVCSKPWTFSIGRDCLIDGLSLVQMCLTAFTFRGLLKKCIWNKLTLFYFFCAKKRFQRYLLLDFFRNIIHISPFICLLVFVLDPDWSKLYTDGYDWTTLFYKTQQLQNIQNNILH